MSTQQIEFSQLISQAKELATELKPRAKQTRLKELEAESIQPGFWNKENAKNIMQEIGWLRSKLKEIHQLTEQAADLETYLELKEEFESEEESRRLEQEAQTTAHKLNRLVDALGLERYLSGRYDSSNAIISIHPGQGGTEAQDWAEMLERMYLRYFEKKDWSYDLIEEIRGEEAGIKEASFEVHAPYSYGYLKGEKGTHRLVRLSPFNADNLRQTSFALVEVMPVISDDSEIELKDEDLSWHFTRAGGPGGQSVNKTNSAVELTHLPSQITVKSRAGRSQVDNKKQALKILKSKLAQLQEERLEKALKKERGEHQAASWGTQIRNYVLHPYQLVKDTRTKVETSDAAGVLDGDLDQFIEEEIKLTSQE